MTIIKDVTLTSLEEILAFDLVTGEYKFTLDELQSANINNTQEKVDITGKGGRKLSSLKKNKGVTITGTNGLLSGGLMELQTGNTFVTKETTVKVPEYLTVMNNAAATTYKAVGTTGAELEVFVRNADGSLGEKLEQKATATAAGEFAYAPATKTISFFGSAYPDGTEVAVFYFRKINADVIENLSDVYSEKCALYINAFGEDKCGNVYRVQFYIPKADFNGNFEFSLGGDQTVHNFEAESLAGACGTGGKLWDYTIWGEDTADVATS